LYELDKIEAFNVLNAFSYKKTLQQVGIQRKIMGKPKSPRRKKMKTLQRLYKMDADKLIELILNSEKSLMVEVLIGIRGSRPGQIKLFRSP
jgi:hypothetical protein